MGNLAELGLSIRSDGVVVATDRLKDFEGAGQKAETAVKSLTKMAVRAGALIAGAFSIRVLQQYADAWSDMQSRVGAAVKKMEAAPQLMRRIVDIANASYSPLQQTVEIFGRNVVVLQALGRTATEAADFTEALNHALVTTATKGQDADVVLNALSRSIAIGGLRAMEFETIMSRSPRVLEAIAEEMGTNVTGLRALAQEGKVTGQVITDALINSLEKLREEAGAMPATLNDAKMIWNNVFNEIVGRIDQAWQVSSRLAAQTIEMAFAFRGVADVVITLGNLLSNSLGPGLTLISAHMDTVGKLTTVAVMALGGLFAPAVMAGLSGLAIAIGTGVVGAINAVTVAMMANPLGLLVAGLTAAITAAFVFRDEIKQAIGIDVIEVAQAAGNMLIQSFDLAFRNIATIWGALPSVLGDITISTANAVIGGIQTMINGAVTLINDFTRGARDALGALGIQVGDIGGVSLGGFDNPYAGSLGGVDGKLSQNLTDTSQIDYLGELSSALSTTWENASGAADALGSIEAALVGGGTSDAGGAAAGGGVNGALQAANDNLDQFQHALDLVNSVPQPFEQMRNDITALDDALAAGVISWEQYNAAAARSMAGAANATLGSLSQISGALAQAFEGNKAFAVANAVINTAEGVTKALAQGGMFAFPIAAAIAAAGAAQIGAILSASPGGGSSGSVRAPSAPSVQNGQQRQQAERQPDRMDITLHGLDRNAMYSGDNIERLIGLIEERSGDGRILNIKVA